MSPDDAVDWTAVQRAVHRWSHAPHSLDAIPHPPALRVCAPPPDSASALIALLHDSLERGHWRVACKRYLMSIAAGVPVPEQVATRCRSYLALCRPVQVDRMTQQAQHWARMREPVASRQPAEPVADTGVRTTWAGAHPYAGP